MDAVLRFVERGLGVAIVPAMVLIDRPGLRSVRLAEPTLDRTISIARPADVAPTAAVEVMRRTITASATAFAAERGRPCGSPVRARDLGKQRRGEPLLRARGAARRYPDLALPIPPPPPTLAVRPALSN